MNNTSEQGRAKLNFANVAKVNFAFLLDLGFTEIESLPTLVRYRKDDIEVSVYHGRRSYEIGVDVTRNGVEYALTDFIGAIDDQAEKQFQMPMASTQEGVAESLVRIGELAKRYCAEALQKNDPVFFIELERKRKLRIEKYWLEMRASQVRPQAHEAFRLGAYGEAAELYKQIHPLLTEAELKKLAIAEERAKGQQ